MERKKQDGVRLNDHEETIGRLMTRAIRGEGGDSRCLSDEEIAMFIDGKTSERERMMEHLAACSSCRRVLRESTALRDDLKTALPERRTRYIWYAAPAAMAALLLLAVMFRNPFSTRSTPKNMPMQAGPEEMKTQSADIPPVTKDGARPRKRLTEPPSLDMIATQLLSDGNGLSLMNELKAVGGGAYGFAASVQAEKNAFRAGVLLTDLEVSIRAGDREKSGMVLRALVAVLETDGDAAAPLAAGRAALAGLEQGRPVKTYAGVSREVEKFYAGTALSDFVAFGAWAEGGRLAAAIEKREFLAYYKYHDYFTRVVREKNLPQGIETSLNNIGLITKKIEAQHDHLKRLEREFQNLILLMD